MDVSDDGETVDTISIQRSDGLYVARSESAGVASQGSSEVAALENLTDAMELKDESVPEEVDEDLEESDAPWL